MSTRTRNYIIIVAVLLLGAFLIGYIPQYQRAGALEQQLQQSHARVQSLEREAALTRARELAYLTHLAAARKNYGIATRHAEELFNHLQTLQRQYTTDETVQRGMQELIAQREAVIADLAQATPAADERVSELLDRIRALGTGAM